MDIDLWKLGVSLGLDNSFHNFKDREKQKASPVPKNLVVPVEEDGIQRETEWTAYDPDSLGAKGSWVCVPLVKV